MGQPTTVTVTLVAAASVPADALPTVDNIQLSQYATWDIPLESGVKLKPNAEPTVCQYTTTCEGATEAVLGFGLAGSGDCRYACTVGWNGSCEATAKVVTLGSCEYSVTTPSSGGNSITFEMQP